MAMRKIGIVIPARNEQHLIAACLNSLKPFQEQNDLIIVVDAQSEDDTTKIAESYDITVLHSNHSQRGLVIAQGIEYIYTHHPTCEFLIIAHADMLFSHHARDSFLSAIENQPGIQWGCFGSRIQNNGLGYRLLEWGNYFRARFLRIPFGDQVQFFRLESLKRVGFPQQPWLEDLELCYRFQNEKRFRYLNEPVLIPARHWKKGIVKTTLRNWRILYEYRKNRLNRNLTYNAFDQDTEM